MNLELTPSPVLVGSPELLRLIAPGATAITGEWLDRKLQFFPAHASSHEWLALAGVDVEAAPGPSTIQLHINANGASRDLAQPVAIEPAHYRTGVLTVPPRFVSPGPEELKQIEADRALKEKIFSTSTGLPLWSGDFRAPVRAQATDSFGTRRTFNGKLASIHKGMDFRAAPRHTRPRLQLRHHRPRAPALLRRQLRRHRSRPRPLHHLHALQPH